MTPLTILIAGFLGFITFKLANYSASGKHAKYSPKQFDFKYWISDRGNWNDLLFGTIVLAVIARYKEQIFTAFSSNFIVDFFEPYKDTEFFYFGLGFTMTFILMLIRMLIDKIKSTIKLLKKTN
jgi:uncharacterized membrane protein